MELGERILQYRAKHRLTQKQMAILLGEGVQAVYKLENRTHKPQKANAVRIALKLQELEEKEERIE